MSGDVTTDRPPVGWRLVIGLLVLIVLVFAVRRLLTDIPHWAAGTVPEAGPDVGYAEHPVLPYLHFLLALPYLVLGPLQLWAPFRRRHYDVHRRVGRIIVSLVLLATVPALVYGVLHPVGGALEASATVVFGLWFLVCLVRAWRAIRADDIVAHRRWMVRAYAFGVGVGVIRIWVGILTAAGSGFATSFGYGFWLGFGVAALVAEWWLRRRPLPPEVATS